MAYLPSPNSLAAHVCAFFKANPHDELSAVDISIKFEVARTNITGKLAEALQHEWLNLIKKGKGETAVYVAGAKIGTVELQPLADRLPPKPSSWPRAASPATPAREPMPDPDDLEIESGIAMPAPIRVTVSKYHAFFARMKDGDSFACSPAKAKLICNNAQKWGKDNGGITFTQRRMTDGTARVWRVGKKGD